MPLAAWGAFVWIALCGFGAAVLVRALPNARTHTRLSTALAAFADQVIAVAGADIILLRGHLLSWALPLTISWLAMLALATVALIVIIRRFHRRRAKTGL
jgi:hypothetical protein